MASQVVREMRARGAPATLAGTDDRTVCAEAARSDGLLTGRLCHDVPLVTGALAATPCGQTAPAAESEEAMKTRQPGRGLATRLRVCLCVSALCTIAPVASLPARAEVTRVDVTRRADVGASGYEKIVGTIHFAIDPLNPRNAVIADLDRVKKSEDGRVVFASDFFILRPLDAARANGVALIEVSNRGNKGLLANFNLATGEVLDPASDADLGDGFLMRAGYTLVWVGWQFDVERRGGRLALDAPIATGVSTVLRSNFIVDRPATTATVTDLAGYVLEADGPDAMLTVRDGLFAVPQPIDRSAWTLNGHEVSLDKGFTPGRTYELTVRATNLPVAGTGLAAFRDIGAWLKFAPDALVSVRHAYAFGLSQSGRFLRTFLYYGFNSDERGRQVFDGVLAHIAGGARLSLNERGARPNQSKAPSPGFPFADAALTNPITGEVDGLLDNDRARANQPKVFYTNSAVEYWGADRNAALVHTTPDGSRDIEPPANVRVYFLAGTQHVPARFPPGVTVGQQLANPLEYRHTLRALLTAMDRWVKDGAAPPASRYPKLADRTLVPVSEFAFPAIPRVPSPRTTKPGRDGAVKLPLLVPAVDVDGNERSGVRTAEQAVPIATFTGWNYRHPSTGAPTEFARLTGSEIPFAKTAAGRSGDPRRSLAERYASKDDYLAQARAHCEALVRDGFLLQGDVAAVMQRANAQWEFVVGR